MIRTKLFIFFKSPQIIRQFTLFIFPSFQSMSFTQWCPSHSHPNPPPSPLQPPWMRIQSRVISWLSRLDNQQSYFIAKGMQTQTLVRVGGLKLSVQSFIVDTVLIYVLCSFPHLLLLFERHKDCQRLLFTSF